MRLTCHGGARSVTGSKHLLETRGGRILLECGLFQGRREEARLRNRDSALRRQVQAEEGDHKAAQAVDDSPQP